MKSVDSTKTLKAIEKMSLQDKQLRILEIQRQGFRYDDKEIKEIIKDKWVFLQNGDDTDIEDIDWVILDWTAKEEVRIEMEEAETGKTVVDKYFKKYGTLSLKEKDGSLYNQTLFFGGKACPGGTWNTELFMYRLGTHKSIANSYDETPSEVNFYADMKVEDLMDAKMKGSEPTLRHCHDWYTSPHETAVNHYKYENWLEDIDTAKNLFVSEVTKLLKGCNSIQYNAKANIYCAPEKFVFWFEEEADHNGDMTKFFKSNIYSKNKYKSSSYRNSTTKVPAKFDKTVSKEEIIELAAKYCEDKLTKHNFRKKFKY